MKVLLIADVHSNWPALRAVNETFDACLFLGDLVDYGMDPVPCIDWIKRHSTAAIRGNHDHAVAHRVIPRSGPGLRRLAAATRPLHWNLVGPHRLKYLSRLPLTRRLEIDGRSFFLVHATPRDPLDEYLTDDPEGWRWGEAHPARMRHAIFKDQPILADLFTIERASGGDSVTVNVGHYAPANDAHPFASVHAASYRALFDLDALEGSRFIANTGQSGNPLSPHYRDLTAIWARGETLPMTTRPDFYRQDALGQLMLLPADPR